MIVREERPEDRDTVRRVQEAAFGRPDEADIVDALRADPAWALSLVAEVDGEIVGHCCSARRPGDDARAARRAAVAPAVAAWARPDARGLGGSKPVVLLGHVDYYTRFGFRPAAPEGITNQWGIDDPAWMVRGELAPGEVRYPAAFATHG